MRAARTFAMVAMLAMAGCSTNMKKGLTPVKFDTDTLWVEVADAEPEREHGLMYRYELPADQGMIFVFDSPHEASFWMRNTPLPLSIAFLDENKVVLNVAQMVPYDDRTFHKSHGLALYAVEANKGWFETRNIGPGAKAEFDIPPKK